MYLWRQVLGALAEEAIRHKVFNVTALQAGKGGAQEPAAAHNTQTVFSSQTVTNSCITCMQPLWPQCMGRGIVLKKAVKRFQDTGKQAGMRTR